MDQGARLVLSMGILTGGTVLALVFRQSAPAVTPIAPELQQSLVLRGTVIPVVEAPASPAVGPPVPQPAPEPPPTVLAKAPRASLDVHETPPLLPQAYPEPPRVAKARWGTTMGLGPSVPGGETYCEQHHKIVDGDTLPALAQRYLGNRDRAQEIFEANRALLPSPDVLPIGVELRIPPRNGMPSQAGGARSLPPTTGTGDPGLGVGTQASVR